MALGGGSLAGVARVSFEAQTGEFNADISRAEQVFSSATRDMSSETIRLELAQDKLRRELAKGPTAFRSQARALLEVRRAEEGLRHETVRLDHAQDQARRGFDRFGRGALAGSGALRGLGRNLAFASAGFLGGTGLVYGMRTAISVASNLEEQTNKVNVVFRESGSEVVEWSQKSSTSFGIAQDRALEYVGTLGGVFNSSGLARTESAKLSQQIVELAADMASFNNASPEDALLALRSGLVGEVEPLRRFAVLLSEAAVAQEALRQTGKASKDELTAGDKVLARYSLILKQTGDQQGDFARTSDGLANSQRTLSALWRDAQGILGQALAPVFTDVVQGLRDWLAEDKNREEMQRTINSLVADGERIVRGFAGGLQFAVSAAKPLVGAMGGIENAVRAATLLWLGFKVKAIAGFAGTALASRATATRMVADAAMAGRAWDVATRPRNMIVTGGGIGGAAGRGGLGGLGRVGRGALGLVGLTPPGAILLGAAAATYFGIKSGQKDALDAAGMQKLVQAARQGKLTGSALEEGRQFLTDAQYRTLRQILVNRSRGQSDQQAPPRGEGRPTPGLTRPGRRGRGGRRTFDFADVERGFAGFAERDIDVQTTEGTSDDAKLARDRLALADRALRDLKLTRDQRLRVKQERLNALQELGRIEQEEEQAAQAIREKQAAARQAAHEKAVEVRRKEREDARKREEAKQRAEERAFDDFERRTRARDLRSTKKFGAGSGFGGGLGSALSEAKKGRGKGSAGDGEKGLTTEEIRRQFQQMSFEFLGSLQGVVNEAAGNLLPAAGGNPDSFRMVNELTEQTSVLKTLASGTRAPGTRYARTEFSALFDGATY